MGESAEELRRDIEDTRAGMAVTVDAIGERVRPGRIIARRRDRMRSGFGSVRDSVMGAPHHVHSAVSEGTSTAASDVGQLKDEAYVRASGNPFAAGLIAFGAGMLAATLIPPADGERRAAGRAKDAAGPLMEPVQEAAHEVVDLAKEHGQEAVAAVKDTATSAGSAVAETATTQTKETAQQAKQQASGPKR